MGGYEIGLLEPFARGEGFQNLVVGVAPGAGNNYRYTLDSNYHNRLLAIRFTLTASAVAANRVATVDYLRSDGDVALSDAPAVVQTASSTGVYNGTERAGGIAFNTGTPAFFPLSGFWLDDVARIGITVAAIDTGDTLTAIYLWLEQIHRTGHEDQPRRLRRRR